MRAEVICIMKKVMVEMWTLSQKNNFGKIEKRFIMFLFKKWHSMCTLTVSIARQLKQAHLLNRYVGYPSILAYEIAAFVWPLNVNNTFISDISGSLDICLHA